MRKTEIWGMLFNAPVSNYWSGGVREEEFEKLVEGT